MVDNCDNQSGRRVVVEKRLFDAWGAIVSVQDGAGVLIFRQQLRLEMFQELEQVFPQITIVEILVFLPELVL